MTTWQALLDQQQGMATRTQLADAGLTRRGLDRERLAGRLHRIAFGVYADRALPTRGEHLLTGGTPDPGFAAEVRRAVLRLPGACAARRTAAVLWGFDMLHEPAEVELDVPHGHRPPPIAGVQCRQARRSRVADVVPVAGCLALPVTSAVDTVLDCAAELPLSEAVAVADSALRRGACTRTQLRRAVSARRGLPFAGRLWRVVRWCDPRCGSLLESLLRVLLCEAGLRPPRTQHRIADAGVLIGRVDFAWPAQLLVVEADGRRWHDPADARDGDRRRDNGCARLGWRVLRFTWAEVVHEPEKVVAHVRAALAARAGTPLSDTRPVHPDAAVPAGATSSPRVPAVRGWTASVPAPRARAAADASTSGSAGREGTHLHREPR